MTTTQPTSTSRKWLRKYEATKADLERAVRAQCGRSKRRRRQLFDLAASELSSEHDELLLSAVRNALSNGEGAR